MRGGWASAWLAQVAEDARLCRTEALAAMADEAGGRRSGGVSVARGSVSDPMAAVDARMDRDAARAARMERSAASVEECERVLDGMAAAGLRVEAYVVGLRDLDGMSWSRVALALGTSVSTVKRRRRVAVDWLDHVGPTRARMGVGTATESRT